MALFTWSEKYSVKVAEIDEQHKKLIGLVNRLNDAMRQGQGKQALSGVLKELVQYAANHFATEERIMLANGYPDYQEHKTKHDKITKTVLDVQAQYEQGQTNITFELMDYLANWVDKHILGTDMRYSSFLVAKGVR